MGKDAWLDPYAILVALSTLTLVTAGSLVFAAAVVIAIQAYRGLSDSPAASKAGLRVTT